MQIKELEAEVGLPLFDRTSRQVSLTTVGEYMLAHTRRVLSAMRDAGDLVARFRGLKTGPLDVGMVSTANYFLPRLLAQFREEHMGIALLSLHTLGLELSHRLIAAPETEGLPVMRRWHVVHNLAKTLSPAAAAFRYFILERGEAFLARQFQTEPDARLA